MSLRRKTGGWQRPEENKQTNTLAISFELHVNSTYFLMIVLGIYILFCNSFPWGNFRPYSSVCNSYQNGGEKHNNGNFTSKFFWKIQFLALTVSSICRPDVLISCTLMEFDIRNWWIWYIFNQEKKTQRKVCILHLVVETFSFIFTVCALRVFVPWRCQNCPKLTAIHIEMASSELSRIPVSAQVAIPVREQQNRCQFKAHINIHWYSMCECITWGRNLVISI